MHDKTTTTLHFDELTLSYLLDNPSTADNLLAQLRTGKNSVIMNREDERRFSLLDEETEVSFKKQSDVIKLTIDENQPSKINQGLPTISIEFYDPYREICVPDCDSSMQCMCNNRFYEMTETVLSSKAEMIAKMKEELISIQAYVDTGSYRIFNTSGFQLMPIDEVEDLALVCKKAAFVKKYGLLGVRVFIHCGDLDHAARYLDENYKGSWDSKGAFAQHFWHEICANLDICTNLSELAVIDAQRFCEEIFQKYFFSVIVRGKVNVFRRELKDSSCS